MNKSSLVFGYAQSGLIEEALAVFHEMQMDNLAIDSFTIESVLGAVALSNSTQNVEALTIAGKDSNRFLISWTAMIASNAQHRLGAEAFRVLEFMRESGIKPDSLILLVVLSACSHNGLVEEGYIHLNLMVKDYGITPLLTLCLYGGSSCSWRYQARKTSNIKVIELEPCDAGAYILLSNICADVGQREEVLKIRSVMEGTGMKKESGWSSA
ncbi:hypothetical protein F0562_023442 [Nyssa sinensis]|uniref:Pentatricopeptide repeat-containing protein n=1 Tax=Nyssa sinensis TaxID=561372 RepID=A0A5J5BL46_9ASTE|nr:hypothetical protein F0562_023442 [Nyssa sinensis]